MKLDAAAQVEVAELDRRDGVAVHAQHILRLQVAVGDSCAQIGTVRYGKSRRRSGGLLVDKRNANP